MHILAILTPISFSGRLCWSTLLRSSSARRRQQPACADSTDSTLPKLADAAG